MADPGADSDRCPECGATLTADSPYCPSCETVLTDRGDDLTDAQLEAFVTAMGTQRLSDARFEAAVPRWIRLVVGLAITIPLVPLGLFVFEVVWGLSIPALVVIVTGGWLLPAWVLSRQDLPTLIVANGLLALGGSLVVTPPAIVAIQSLLGRPSRSVGWLGGDLLTVEAAFLVPALVVIASGLLVRRYATRKLTSATSRPASPER
jgi:hypothetical protein